MGNLKKERGKHILNYVYLLLVAGVLVFFAAGYVTYRLNLQKDDFSLINQAGRLRMVSQAYAKTVYLEGSERTVSQDSIWEELNTSFNQLHETIKALPDVPDTLQAA